MAEKETPDEETSSLYQYRDQSNLTHDEIWDDTLLIQQYDKAMAKARKKLSKGAPGFNTSLTESGPSGPSEINLSENGVGENIQKKKKKKKNKKRNEWHTGDACRLRYSDGRLYEATIISLDSDKKNCFVRFVGYNNEESAQVSQLKKTLGEHVRRMQEKEAIAEGFLSVESDAADGGSSVAESDIDTDAERSSKRQRAPTYPSTSMPPPNSPYAMAGGMPAAPPHLPYLPPPPALGVGLDLDGETSEALHTMLMSWYMTGYHTGYYQGIRQGQNQKKHK